MRDHDIVQAIASCGDGILDLGVEGSCRGGVCCWVMLLMMLVVIVVVVGCHGLERKIHRPKVCRTTVDNDKKGRPSTTATTTCVNVYFRAWITTTTTLCAMVLAWRF